MRFFESKVELKGDSVVDFLCTAANMLLFGPFRLVQEISKKVVYLSKNDLTRVFFTSVIVALFFTAANAVAQVFTGSLNIFTGKMPIVLMLICSVILLGIYCVVSSKDWTILDSRGSIDKLITKPTRKPVEEPVEEPLEKTIEESPLTPVTPKSVEPIKAKPAEATEPMVEASHLELDDDFLLDEPDFANISLATDGLVADAISWLDDNDTFEAKPNSDVLGDGSIKEYQNRLEGGIAELERIGDTYDKFSADEVKLLQEKLNAVTTSDRFLSKEFITNFSNNLILDEECNLKHGVDEVDESFTLCEG